MAEGRFKSKTFRKIFRKTPGGRLITHYSLRKPKKAHCANCGKPLAGVLRARPVKLRTTAKTKKRPERPFGGVLCSRCMRQRIKEVVRANK
jgi:large subunit ribosomal protein L34e